MLKEVNLKCACYYWKCGYYNRDTEICSINNKFCFLNRMELEEEDNERI